MIVICPARESGKTFLLRQRLCKAVEEGKKVLMATKSGLVVIDKDGAKTIPSGQWHVPENIQLQRELIASDYRISEELANDMWKKAMEEYKTCRKSR